ncbi:FAS1 domain-containing protein [Halteromyces radiatus]|uniref:FAS1 domain-containing protein n=1 Tax=Halteromyces radiatus TaxID=101107 RepID=UPI002220DA9F|nr:FAS1 domain-containing protein [Halteromyces radiatus]KAI8083015.1 FAS1 domain-containing protein [Halteromyces radiatus]
MISVQRSLPLYLILYLTLLVLLSQHTVASIANSFGDDNSNKTTIIDILIREKRFQILLDHLNRTQLLPFVNDLTSTTLFAPDDKAFEQYQGQDIDKDILLYHFITKGMTSQDFYNDQLLTSLYVRPDVLGPSKKDHGQRIKVTTEDLLGKDHGKVYVNQVQITTQDIQVNNETYIQVLDQVLSPPLMLDKLLEEQYQAHYNAMKLVDVEKMIGREKPYTVFATKVDVFGKFNTIENTYLLSGYGKRDLQRYLNYMVIVNYEHDNGGPLYSIDLPRTTTNYKTANGEIITVEVSEDGGIKVNGIAVVKKDILAANGVLHELEGSLVPNSLVFDTRKYLYGLNTTKYVSLLDRFGLSQYLDASYYNYTFLAPENDAIDENAIPNHSKHDWLSYHLSNGSWTKDLLHDGMMLKSQYASEPMDGALQRIPVFVENEEIFSAKLGKSIRFDNARVITDIGIQGNTIYKVTDPLKIPGDVLSRLVVDLDLSTFIATLYVSELADEIRHAKGITLFVPTNDAFKRLGLLAKYLVHPTGKQHLQTILRFHAAQKLLYYDDMLHHVYEVPTLSKSILRIRATKDQQHVVVGRPDGSDAEAGMIVVDGKGSNGGDGNKNILMSNGVVHKLNEVQIPSQVKINNYDLLVGIGATTMVKVLERANMTDVLNRSDCVVLAPTDKAFAHVDLDNLYNNPDQLNRIARFHLLSTTWHQDSTAWQADYQTHLSDKDKVIIKKEGGDTHKGGDDDDDLIVVVKDKESMMAQVTGLGRATTGQGGVLEINTVLVPIRRGVFGLPFVWSVVVLIIIILIVSLIVGVIGFFTYKIYNRRRLGYRAV